MFFNKTGWNIIFKTYAFLAENDFQNYAQKAYFSSLFPAKYSSGPQDYISMQKPDVFLGLSRTGMIMDTTSQVNTRDVQYPVSVVQMVRLVTRGPH